MKVGIITTRDHESSSEEVIDWLRFKGATVDRINAESYYSNEFSIEINTGTNEKLDYDVIWIRRWASANEIKCFFEKYKDSISFELLLNLVKSRENDLKTVRTAILSGFKTKRILSSIRQLTVNKLDVLRLAAEVGLNIPATIVTKSKAKLLEFYQEHQNNIITKDLDGPFFYSEKEYSHCVYVNKVIDIQLFPEYFPVSFFQEKIDKSIEIRTFYLDKKMYSMAIFSQSDSQTEVDFRRYNMSTPNRTVPYKLPKLIENKIIELMENLKLETGSIDLIKTKDSRFVFLEVNPVGQFGMTSFPCNYYLEKIIAEFLLNENEKQIISK